MPPFPKAPFPLAVVALVEIPLHPSKPLTPTVRTAPKLFQNPLLLKNFSASSSLTFFESIANRSVFTPFPVFQFTLVEHPE